MKFLLDLGILLLVANIGGMISRKFKQPAVLGQIIAGIILGMGFLTRTELIGHLSEIGVIFLMFIAGLETDVEELKESGVSSTTVAIAGVIVPMVLVSGAAYLFTHNWISSIVVGLISIATSVSISVQTLKELGHLKSKQGVGILGAAIIDDIIGVILLTIVVGIARPSDGANVGMVIGKIALFFVLVGVIGFFGTKFLNKLALKKNAKDSIVSFAIIVCFILSFISEEFGVAAVTGAYFAGVIFSMSPFNHKISHDIQIISDVFFTPIFFASIGLGLELSSVGKGMLFSMVMLVLGIIGKVVGCGFGAKMTGFSVPRALQIGIGMVPRAEVSLIIANLGLQLSLINQQEFSSAIVLVITTTLITPSMLKWAFRDEESLNGQVA